MGENNRKDPNEIGFSVKSCILSPYHFRLILCKWGIEPPGMNFLILWGRVLWLYNFKCKRTHLDNLYVLLCEPNCVRDRRPHGSSFLLRLGRFFGEG